MKLRAAGSTLIVLCAAGVIGLVQPRLSAHFTKTTHEDTTYALPAPEQLALFTLGYREAFADYLFGSTLVESGIHFNEKRVFADQPRYLNAVTYLDPYYRDVYYYADALLTLSTVLPLPSFYRDARDLQEKGLALFPYDVQFWISAGDFLSYLAPPHLPANEDPEEWKTRGAQLFDHACSLSLEASDDPRCGGAAKTLGKAGNLEAAIGALERVIRLSQNPEQARDARARLETLVGIKVAKELEAHRTLAAERRRADLPFVSEELYALIPRLDALDACAGRREIPGEARCGQGD